MRPLSLLRLEPEAILFERVPGSPEEKVSKALRISNASDGRAAWKVRTTAPGACLVTPRAGVLKPEEVVEATITIMPASLIGDLRFEVRAAAVGPERDTIGRAEWAQIPQSDTEVARVRGILRGSNRVLNQGAGAGDTAGDEVRRSSPDSPSGAGERSRGRAVLEELQEADAYAPHPDGRWAVVEESESRWQPGRPPRTQGFGAGADWRARLAGSGGASAVAAPEGEAVLQRRARRVVEGTESPPEEPGAGAGVARAKGAAADAPPPMGPATKAVLAVLIGILAFNLYIRPYLDW